MIYWAINCQRLDKLSLNFTSNMCHHIKLFKDANTKIWLRTSKKDSFIQILFVNNINFHWILNKLKSHISHIPVFLHPWLLNFFVWVFLMRVHQESHSGVTKFIKWYFSHTFSPAAFRFKSICNAQNLIWNMFLWKSVSFFIKIWSSVSSLL